MSSPRVLLACCGLDHAQRGYESFARECFQALAPDPALELDLVKASGRPGVREHVAPALRRDRPVALRLGRALGFRPFRLEALSFAVGLQPLLFRRDPHLVYLSEWDTARALASIRRLTGQRFRILLCNGGFAASGFGHLDHVQELTPAARDHVLRHGGNPLAHTVLPLGFEIPPEFTPISSEDRSALRRELGLPDDRPIVLSVAALNSRHKRLDYLIGEVAQLPRPRPFLLMAGAPDEETPEVRSLALAQLGDGFAMRTVPRQDVEKLYRASDVFVLASLAEMQGRALIEAASHGLPCLAHDGPVMRFALGDNGFLADLNEPGALAGLLREQAELGRDTVHELGLAAHRHVYERFSWDRLRPRYVELLTEVALAKSTVSSSTGEKLPR